MGVLKVQSTNVYPHDSISIAPDATMTFAVATGPEFRTSQPISSLESGHSQIPAFMGAECEESRIIEDEETVAETPMHAVCEVITQSSSTRKGNGVRGRGQAREVGDLRS
jgi:hypothetical protein